MINYEGLILEKINKSFSFFDFNSFSKIFILTDENIAKHWLGEIKRKIKKETIDIVINSGEKEKNIKTALFIWKKMIEAKADRNSLLINLGGGVILDLGGFTASVFMRGINFINIPTTLLAMVDACIGGKTGINFYGIKNIIGSFAYPKKIIIDINFLTTLPKRYFLEGWAEIIKHGIIAGGDYFSLLTRKNPVDYSDTELEKIITKSIEIKLNIVLKDPNERGLRKILNFGHTLGHAFESLFLRRKNFLLHGEAVALGMIGESYLSYILGYLSMSDFLKIKNAINNAGLPEKINLKKSYLEKIFKIISFDKKNLNGKILFSLPKKIGKVDYNIEVPKELIVDSLNYFSYENN